MLEQGTTMTSRKPSASMWSDRKIVASTQPDERRPEEVEQDRDADAAEVPAGLQQCLEPDVDHHRIDDEEDRDRGQIADRARVGLGRGLEKVAHDEPE